MDGTSGTTAIAAEDVSADELAIAESVDDDGNAAIEDLTIQFGEYYQGKIYSVAIRQGYGARLSAPGYMDCTEWAVFDTVKEAEQYLNEQYPEDEEDEDEDAD